MENNIKNRATKMSVEEIHGKIMKGYESYREGRVQDAAKAFAEFRKCHGFHMVKVD